MTTTIFVYDDYTQPNLIFPIPGPGPNVVDFIFNTATGHPCGVYKQDYLLIHYTEMIRREINNDVSVTNNSHFQELVKRVLEYDRILRESRISPTKVARDPFWIGNGVGTSGYACPTGHLYDDAMRDALKDRVDQGYNPLIYGIHLSGGVSTPPLIPFAPNTPLGIYVQDNCGDTLPNFFTRVVTGVNDAATQYFANKGLVTTPPNLDAEYIEKHKDAMAQINNAVANSDYENTLTYIERMINLYPDSLKQLNSSSATNSNINISTPSLDSHYDFTLKYSDIDGALVISTEEDTVDQGTAPPVVNSLYTNLQGANVFTNAMGAQSLQKYLTNATNTINDLLSSFAKKSNITAYQGILDLADSKIYLDPQGEPIVKQLTDVEKKALKDDMLDKQTKYLETLKDVPNSRMEVYKTAYPKQTYGGGIITDIYKKTKYSNQRVSLTQTGGREIDFTKLNDELKENKKEDISEEKKFKDLGEIHKRQDELTFGNDKFVDVDGFEQKNEYLIEMMNINILQNFFIGKENTESKGLFDAVSNKIDTFKKDLTDIWDISKSNIIKTGKMNTNFLLDQILANNSATINDIKVLLNSVTQNTPPLLSGDAVIDSSSILTVLRSLGNKYGFGNNIGIITEKIADIIKYSPTTVSDKKESIFKLYDELKTFYIDVKSLNSALYKSYSAITSKVNKLSDIKKNTGKIMKNNIDTVNILTGELITTFQYFDILNERLIKINAEIVKIIRRIEDFSIYIEKTSNALEKFKGKLDRSIIDALTNTAHGNQIYPKLKNFLKSFFDYHNDYYIKKIVGASKNMIKYVQYDIDKKSINNTENHFNTAIWEFEQFNKAFTKPANDNPSLTKVNPTVIITDAKQDSKSNLGKIIKWFNEINIIYIPNIINRIHIPETIYIFTKKYITGSIKDTLIEMYKYKDTNSNLNAYSTEFQLNLYKYLEVASLLIPDVKTLVDTKKAIVVASGLRGDDAHLKIISELLDTDPKTYAIPIPLPVTFGIDKIFDKLVELFYGANNPLNQLTLHNKIAAELNKMISEIWYLYYECLLDLYQSANNLVLINNIKTPVFIKIQDAQIILSKQNIFLQWLKIDENIFRLATEIYPRRDGGGSADRPAVAYYNMIYQRNNKLIRDNTYNIINYRDTGGLCNDQNKTIFKDLKLHFDQIYLQSESVLTLYCDQITENMITPIPASKLYNIGFNYIPDANSYPAPFAISTNANPTANSTNLGSNLYTAALRAPMRQAPNAFIVIAPPGLINITYTYNVGTMDFDAPIQLTATDNYIIPTSHGSKLILNIPEHGPITVDNAQALLRFMRIINILFDFRIRLDSISNILSTPLIFELTTWGNVIPTTDPKYRARQAKRDNLLKILDVIAYITNTIQNSGYDDLSNMLGNNTGPFADIEKRTRTSLLAINISDVGYNKFIDGSTIVFRRLSMVLYSIFTSVISRYILQYAQICQNLIINISTNGTAQSNTAIQEVIKYGKKITDIKKEIDNELEKKKNTIDTNQDKFPALIKDPNFDYATQNKLPKYKFLIENSPKRNKINSLVSYDKIFTNSKESQDICFIYLLIKEKKTKEAEKLVESMEKTMYNITYFPILNKIVENITNLYDSGNYINNRDSIAKLKALYGTALDKNAIASEICGNFYLKIWDFVRKPSFLVKNPSFNRSHINFDINFKDVSDLTHIQIWTNKIIAYNSSAVAAAAILPTRLTFDENASLGNPAEEIQYYKNALNNFNNNPILFIQLVTTEILIKIREAMRKIILDILNINITTNLSNMKFGTMSNHIIDKVNNYIGDINIFCNIDGKPDIFIASLALLDTFEKKYKYAILSPSYYASKKNECDIAVKITKEICSKAGKDLMTYYNDEMEQYNKKLSDKVELITKIESLKRENVEKIGTVENIIQTINRVMFNEHYKKTAYISQTDMLTLADTTVSNYNTIADMIKNNLLDIEKNNNKRLLKLNQINNYIAFKTILGRTLNNKYLSDFVYARMSIGLIEFYFDIIDSIIECIDNEDPEKLKPVEQYLYKFHYIQLKRCYVLFSWIINDYRSYKKQEYSKLKKSGANVIPIMNYKIELKKVSGEALIIFSEFQELRRYLDDYNATSMEPVQLHLRINDFVSKKPDYNKNTKDLITNTKDLITNNYLNVADYSELFEYPTDDNEYIDKWDRNQLLFTVNNTNANILNINFDVLEKISKIKGNPDDSQYIYNDTYKLMKPTPIGIRFRRIYDTITFPNTDVIANYMSIAANIKLGKGTVILTYGYSGVGKSVSLFGQVADPSKDKEQKNGILQSTFSQIKGKDIFFRVFEIYGLGAPYSFYWNKEPACFPDVYQCVIHHVLDGSGPVLDPKDRLIFMNRHDIYGYILDLMNPKRTTSGFVVKNTNDSNLAGQNGPNYSTYFDTMTNALKISTYVKISKDQYQNFTSFIDKVDKLREEGVLITTTGKSSEPITQIKATVNNPSSSRSILVYDFEIEIEPDVFVPFLIYDLPGKEDIEKSYIIPGVNPTDKDEEKKKAFHNITNDLPDDKVRKGTLSQNPILLPIFNDWADKMVTELKTSIITPHLITEIITKTISTEVTLSQWYMSPAIPDYKDVSTAYIINSLFSSNPTNFDELFNGSKIANVFKNNDPIGFFNATSPKGIASAMPLISINVGKFDKFKKELEIYFCIVVMVYLFFYNLFDIIISIIYRVTGSATSDSDGGWTKNKIYTFFEAYYINENVVGLLQYLVKEILDVSDTGIKTQEQDPEVGNLPINKTINSNLKLGLKYRALIVLKNNHIPRIDNEYNFIIKPNYLFSINNYVKARKIKTLANATGISTCIDIANDYSSSKAIGTCTFAKENDNTNLSIERMERIINFTNGSLYDNNKIYRDGETVCNNILVNIILNPMHTIKKSLPKENLEHNYPLLKDFLEPYRQKISFYYVFFVVSNTQVYKKAEEQIKLINNSMPFISKMDPTKKKKCV